MKLTAWRKRIQALTRSWDALKAREELYILRDYLNARILDLLMNERVSRIKSYNPGHFLLIVNHKNLDLISKEVKIVAHHRNRCLVEYKDKRFYCPYTQLDLITSKSEEEARRNAQSRAAFAKKKP